MHRLATIHSVQTTTDGDRRTQACSINATVLKTVLSTVG